ncbi:NlpC/P60 family protein [Ramlibacter sp.]|uniref:C40 family peptidase n=1 Tax=Ramlibacter sp. TaxID=1917967 RepID=UPI001848EDD4|nr:NlpC/P60 family protein [Ramlibacter sp.]MBA2676326.1 C40 family peptidase [Ramlibacter sp.]
MTNRTIEPLPAGLKRVVAIKGITPLREEPAESAPLETQVLYGETLGIRAQVGAWYQASVEFSGFCHTGYVRIEDVAEPPGEATHRVQAHVAQIVSAPSLKALHVEMLSRGSLLRVIGETEEHFRVWPRGWVFKEHAGDLAHKEADFVDTMASFAGTPYIWGGRSTLGQDCSGMIQLALSLCGLESPRAMSDMSEHLGRKLEPDEPLRRGDFLFYSAHCVMALDQERVLHGNGRLGYISVEDRETLHRRMTEYRGYPLIARRRLQP